MTKGARRFTELRAWEACDIYKQAVLRICRSGSLARDSGLREQLEDSASGPTDHIAEGFGRFSPADFARYTVFARSSLMESQNQLRTAAQKGHITEERRLQLNGLAEVAIQETTGLMEYLQSEEAQRNADRVRRRREERRAARRQAKQQRKANQEPNQEPNREPNPERNREPKLEPKPESNEETRTENREHRTKND